MFLTKRNDKPRVGLDFGYPSAKLKKLKIGFPLVRDCLKAIVASRCDVMSVIDLTDANHTI